ncbi:Gfo/Idh/MocA family oxidoreductase, partial [Clostridium saudiense]|nr:Gfo/Idh/MocA family oxidoreductase [Clostridium saudiense]
VYEDYKKMLDEQPEIDVVIIATESGYHADIAINCMNRNKHVIVEKPMAMSIEDAEKMIEVARKNNVKLSVGHQKYFFYMLQKQQYLQKSLC